MRTSLAPTSMNFQADEKLLVKDVYDIEGSENNTSVIDVLKDVGSDITKAIRTTPGAATRIAQLAVEAKTGRLSNASILQRVTGLLGGSRTLDSLTGKVSNGLSKAFGMDPMLTNQVVTVLKDAAGNTQQVYNRYGSYTNMNNASGIVSSIQRFLGNKDIFEEYDLGAEAALVGELLNQAVRAGIPSAIDVMLRNAANEQNARYIVSRNIAPILFSGDVATMESVLNHISAPSVASLRPNFAQDFLANFRLPFNTTKADYLSYKNRILALLNTINPSWAFAKRGEVLIPSLAPFTRMSQDAKLVFAMSDAYATEALIASSYQSASVASLVRSQYPYLPI